MSKINSTAKRWGNRLLSLVATPKPPAKRAYEPSRMAWLYGWKFISAFDECEARGWEWTVAKTGTATWSDIDYDGGEDVPPGVEYTATVNGITKTARDPGTALRRAVNAALEVAIGAALASAG